MNKADAATIAIIGAGFSGVATAVHFLRRGLGKPGKLLLVNRSGRMARGVAYGTRTEAHVLNVAAGRMSALADDEESFLRFAQARDPNVTGGSFVPRQLYGDYLEQLLEDAVAHPADGVECERFVGEVVAIEPRSDVRAADITLSDGRRVRAERVVLAVGNYGPADVPLPALQSAGPGYVRDPWASGALDGVDLDQPALLIGTGLTMVDIALDLHQRGLRKTIHAVSRRGLVPQPHRSPSLAPDRSHLPEGIAEGPATARAYLRAVRRRAERGLRDGLDWREIVNSLRPLTPLLWQRLPLPERARFVRHLRPYWEAHRHRMAPELAARLREMLAAGALTITAGRLVGFVEKEGWLEVEVRLRAGGKIQLFRVGSVINCTGPNSDTRTLREPLIAQLASGGILRRDALGLGIDVAPDGALIDTEGRASASLYYVGPFLKARDWEATAVPELRVFAARLAETLRGSFSEEESRG